MSEIRVDSFKAEDGISAPQFPNGINVTGVVTATVLDSTVPFLNAGNNIQLGAAGIITATELKATNVSVAGTLTYEDVSNVDSIGIITARSGVDVDDFVSVGNNIHLGNAGVVTATSFSGSGANLTNLSGSNIASALSGEDISGLGNIGINANLTARKISVTDDGSSSPLVSIMSDDGSPWAFQIGNSTSANSVNFGIMNYVNNSGNAFTYVAGNGAYKEWTYSTNDGSTTNTVMKFNTDRSVSLYYQNSSKFYTTTNGVTVTGTVTDTKGELRNVPQVTASSNLVIVSSHAGKHILHSGTGGWTINTSTGFAVGDMVTFINHSGSAQTIFQASGVTLYDTADGATGDHSVAARGMVTAINVASNVFYLSGNIA